MVVIRSKKSRKQRGSRTHGWGAGKKHRGAGHRGGKGHAGFGKRGQQRLTKAFAQGITTLRKRKKHAHIKLIKKAITLEQISVSIEKWLSNKKIKKEKDMYVIDLSEMGYDKLLGTGVLKEKLDINVKECTQIARRKIEALKGKITVPEKEQSPEAFEEVEGGDK